MNPTQDVLEQRVTLLEGGAASVALASGTAAIFTTRSSPWRRTGDEIVSANNLYGGTYTMFDAILPQFGITTKFVKHDDLKNFEKAITPKTRAIFIETIGNPALDVTDIAEVAKIAHKHGLPLDRGCHLHHAVPVEDHRARRGHRREFPHEVAGRARHRHRRHRHRRGQVQLEGQEVQALQRSRSQLPRPAVGARPACRRWRPSPSRCACARFPSATSAHASLPTTRGYSSRASSPSPSAWSGTAERPGRCPVAEEASQGGMGALPRPPGRPHLPRGQQVPQEGLRRHGGVRHQGRAGGGREVHQQPEAVLPPGQRGRREEPRPAPGQHVPLAAHRGAAEGGRA